jgi:hypothetical protein
VSPASNTPTTPTRRATISHIAQCVGGVASPILSNIYLDRFDTFVEQSLLPDYNHGKRRRRSQQYRDVDHAIRRARRRGDRKAVRLLRQRLRGLPSQDPDDPDYRRLRYVRYCDDWLLGFAGPRREAEQIKTRIQTFLRDELRLELSESKTLITHAVSQAARFLGYEIRTQHADAKITSGRRAVNARIGLFVPRDVIRQRCARYMRHGRPAQLGALLHDTDHSIVAKYACSAALRMIMCWWGCGVGGEHVFVRGGGWLLLIVFGGTVIRSR